MSRFLDDFPIFMLLTVFSGRFILMNGTVEPGQVGCHALKEDCEK
ncbi:hypothetical protein [Novipirellula sp.]